MKLLLLPAFFLLAATLAQAQERPTMNPEGAADDGVSGFGNFSQERPKGAETVITAAEQATFDNKTSVAEFIGSVMVRDPQFTLTCERLKAFLKPGGRGLDRVEAIGDVVIRQENADAKGGNVVSVARAGKAIFTPSTGDIDLREWPQISQGINAHVSTEEATTMVLNRAGKINTIGGSKTVIVDGGEDVR